MSGDARSNEQIAADAMGAQFGVVDEYREFIEKDARAVVAALSAAGRLVTPEHDARKGDGS